MRDINTLRSIFSIYHLLRAIYRSHDYCLFPSLVVYTDVESVFRLLRAVYRPANLYCLHVDAAAESEFYSAMVFLASCFPNVFLTSQRVAVKWGTLSVLLPELLCMRELWERSRTWKYFINLTGQYKDSSNI